MNVINRVIVVNELNRHLNEPKSKHQIFLPVHLPVAHRIFDIYFDADPVVALSFIYKIFDCRSASVDWAVEFSGNIPGIGAELFSYD